MSTREVSETQAEWFTLDPNDTCRSKTILQQAFEKAVTLFCRDLTRDEAKREWIAQRVSIHDVVTVAEQAQARYDGAKSHRPKMQKWISELPTRIMCYSPVIDTIAQAHPEYAALAWGAMKFVLMGVVEHENYFTRIAKQLGLIGQALPRIELLSQLYPTPILREALSNLYAHIILFLQKAVSWYCKSSFRRSINAALKPFDVGYKETIDQIRICTEMIDAYADAAQKAECRGITIAQNQNIVKLGEVESCLNRMQEKFDILQSRYTVQEEVVNQVMHYVTGTHSLSQQIAGDVIDTNQRLWDIQRSHILDELRSGAEPMHELRFPRAMSQMRSSWKYTDQASIRTLNVVRRWASRGDSSLLVVQGHPRDRAKIRDLAVDVVSAGLAQKTQAGIIWALSKDDSGTKSPSYSPSVLWKRLVFQILRDNPGIYGDQQATLNITDFRRHREETEWRSLFAHAISNISKCVVVVEVAELFQFAEYNHLWITEFLLVFQNIVEAAQKQGAVLKILVASFCSDKAAVTNLPPSDGRLVSYISRTLPPPPGRLRRAAETQRRYKSLPIFEFGGMKV